MGRNGQEVVRNGAKGERRWLGMDQREVRNERRHEIRKFKKGEKARK